MGAVGDVDVQLTEQLVRVKAELRSARAERDAAHRGLEVTLAEGEARVAGLQQQIETLQAKASVELIATERLRHEFVVFFVSIGFPLCAFRRRAAFIASKPTAADSFSASSSCVTLRRYHELQHNSSVQVHLGDTLSKERELWVDKLRQLAEGHRKDIVRVVSPTTVVGCIIVQTLALCGACCFTNG